VDLWTLEKDLASFFLQEFTTRLTLSSMKQEFTRRDYDYFFPRT